MAKDPRSPFYVQDTLSVIASSTVICARRRPNAAVSAVKLSSSEFPKSLLLNIKELFRGKAYTFMNGWEVLVGQSEVINYLKSTPEKLVTMRYGGEYKLAGGNVDSGESLLECAKRELDEEFLQPLKQEIQQKDVFLRPFNVKQTRPIRSKSNLMHNFIALECENKWLAEIDLDEVNYALKQRRREFMNKVESGEYWGLSKEEKEKVAPEVYEVSRQIYVVLLQL